MNCKKKNKKPHSALQFWDLLQETDLFFFFGLMQQYGRPFISSVRTWLYTNCHSARLTHQILQNSLLVSPISIFLFDYRNINALCSLGIFLRTFCVNAWRLDCHHFSSMCFLLISKYSLQTGYTGTHSNFARNFYGEKKAVKIALGRRSFSTFPLCNEAIAIHILKDHFNFTEFP